MNLNDNKTGLHYSNTQVSSVESMKELKLYNLLFAGKITMKEYLRSVAFGMTGEKTRH